MHIVYMTVDFVNNLGPTTGLPKYLLRVGKTLTNWGHKVTVITCSNRTIEYSFCGINVICTRRPNITKFDDQEKDTLAACSRDGYILNTALHNLLLRETVDIIQYTSLCGIAYYHDVNVPAVMRLSSYSSMWPIDGREKAQMTYAWMEREASKRCQGIFGPARVVAERFGEDIGRKVEVIETPFVMETDQEDNTIYCQYLKNIKYILYFGTIIGYKGLGIIAESIREILRANPDIYYAIIGDGDRKLIEQIVYAADEQKSRVVYIEAIDFRNLKPIIRNARLVTLPSVAENFSNACVEAMALGGIVIGTTGTSFDQLITDGENGFLCKTGDSRSFVQKVNYALAMTEEEQKEMKRKALKRIVKLSPSVVIKELLHYYKKVINSYRGTTGLM